MAEDNCQKIKLLKVMEILRQETDEEHPIKTADLCARLEAMGITCNPRTVGRDVKVMNDHGYEIMYRTVDRGKAYYVSDRSFNVPELKILIDAVQAASFVTDDKAAELIDKIADLGGSHRSTLLKSNIVKFNTRKHSNEMVYHVVEHLEEAIQKNRQVSFKYFDLDETGQRVFRKTGNRYIMEPIALVYSEDNYYLIPYNPKYDGTTNYRVDRMDSVEILEVPISKKAKSLRRKVGKYTESVFKMYNGEPEKVTLQFDEKLIGAVYDKFGEGTKMKRVDEHTIEAKVLVRIAPTFWGWVFQFAGQLRIVSPEHIIEAYQEQIRKSIGKEERE